LARPYNTHRVRLADMMKSRMMRKIRPGLLHYGAVLTIQDKQSN